MRRVMAFTVSSVNGALVFLSTVKSMQVHMPSPRTSPTMGRSRNRCKASRK